VRGKVAESVDGTTLATSTTSLAIGSALLTVSTASAAGGSTGDGVFSMYISVLCYQRDNEIKVPNSP
jgi:hypothetical protein